MKRGGACSARSRPGTYFYGVPHVIGKGHGKHPSDCGRFSQQSLVVWVLVRVRFPSDSVCVVGRDLAFFRTCRVENVPVSHVSAVTEVLHPRSDGVEGSTRSKRAGTSSPTRTPVYFEVEILFTWESHSAAISVSKHPAARTPIHAPNHLSAKPQR